MAPKTLKRPAAAAAGAPSKKIKADQCGTLAAALEQVELPKSVVGMLTSKSFLKVVFETPQEDRHPFQEQVIQMLTEMMEGLEAGLTTKIADAEKKVSDSGTDRAGKEAAEKAAVEAVEAKKTAAEEAKTAAADAITAAKTAKDALATAQSAQKTGDAELEAAAGKKERVEKAKESLAALKTATMEADKVSGAVAELVEVAKEFDFDGTMITTMPSTLCKAVASRGAFDEMVFKQLEDVLVKQIGALADTVTNGEAGKAERAGAVAEASTALEAAEATKTAKCDAKTAAATALKEAETAHKAAVKDVKGHGPLMKHTQKDMAEAKKELEKFTAGPKAAFAELLAFTLVVPEEPEALPAAEAAAPVAAAAEPPAETTN